MKSDSLREDRIRTSLAVSVREGVAASVMLGVTDYYLTPFALYLGATAQQVGFLVALPDLAASGAQLAASAAVRLAGSRRAFLVRGACLQAAVLAAIASLAFVRLQGVIVALIAAQVVFKVLGNLFGPAWGSLMSDYLPPEERGRFFGRRSRVTGAASLASILGAGLLLHAMKPVSAGAGFCILFLIAAAARGVSSILLSKMVDLPLAPAAASEFTFLDFLRRFKESNFVKFVLYVASVTFATNLSAPYISVYLLRELEFSYVQYMAIHLTAVVASLVAFPIWGRHADLAGNAKILRIASFLIPAIPFLWLPSRNVAYLMAVQFFAGFVWGGFNLCSTNFIFDAVVPAKRVRCLGYFHLINGFAVFAGASLGGVLAGRLPALFGSPLLALFAFSGLVRFAAHFVLSGRFKEVRETSQKITSTQLFFSVVGLRPLEGLPRE